VGEGRWEFDGTIADKHERMTEGLLDAMDRTLRRDICDLKKPGARIHEVLASECIKNSHLPKIAYACEYWIEHLQTGMHNYNAVLPNSEWLHIFFWKYLLLLLVAVGLLRKAPTSKDILAKNGKVHEFFGKHLLHWLEAMSLLQKMPEAITALQKLEAAFKVSSVVAVLKS
jgi:hypothetical protein